MARTTPREGRKKSAQHGVAPMSMDSHDIPGPPPAADLILTPTKPERPCSGGAPGVSIRDMARGREQLPSNLSRCGEGQQQRWHLLPRRAGRGADRDDKSASPRRGTRLRPWPGDHRPRHGRLTMERLRCRASLKSTVQAAFKTHLPIPPTHESDARAHIALPKLPIKLAVACPAKSREGQHYSSNGIR